MNDTDMEDDLDGGEADEKAEKRKITRYLARALYRQYSKASDADGTKDERKAGYGDVRSEYRKLARKVLKSLERRGVRMTLVETDGRNDLDDD